jgi:hypothetical protein
MGKFIILKWLLQSFSFQKVYAARLSQIQDPGDDRDLLWNLSEGYVSSIASEVGILRHAIVLVWSGDFDDWGLTSGFAGV